MATYDLTTSATAGVNTNQINALANQRIGRGVKLVQYTFDIADLIAKGTVASSGVAQNDVIKVGTVPANTVVLYSGMEVITATGVSSSAADVGFTTADADSIIDAGDINATGMVTAASTAVNGLLTASHTILRLTADDTIEFKRTDANAAATVGKFRIYIICVNIADFSEVNEVDRDQLA